ncbi:MAG: hypothetical protein GY950_01135 [bacterium]|nr:hypothetical protein [bacterium]
MIIDIKIDQIAPDAAGVLKTQGIPPGTTPPERVTALYNSAEELFLKLAAPIGIMADISIDEFAELYKGIGKNEPDTPLEKIFPKADFLALFAFTLGLEVSREIKHQFKSNGLAVGYMLDAIASYCADKASGAAQDIFLRNTQNTAALLYSPGYCGWHISGQWQLFEYLNPEEIGIQLNPSFLMVPLKSISGVLAAGKKDIHQFKSNYPFCAHCRTRNCRERMKFIDK